MGGIFSSQPRREPIGISDFRSTDNWIYYQFKIGKTYSLSQNYDAYVVATINKVKGMSISVGAETTYDEFDFNLMKDYLALERKSVYFIDFDVFKR